MIIANKLSVESLVDKKTTIVQHSRRRTTAPAGKAHRDALVDFVSFVPPKMWQPGRNNMNLWCVLRKPQNSSNLQGWFSTIRSTFEPKTHARSCIKPHPEVPFCDHFGSKLFWPPIWSTWRLNLLAKYEECKSQIEKNSCRKETIASMTQTIGNSLNFNHQNILKNLSDYDLRKRFYNHAVTSIFSCGTDEGHMLACWRVNDFFLNRPGKIWNEMKKSH